MARNRRRVKGLVKHSPVSALFTNGQAAIEAKDNGVKFCNSFQVTSAGISNKS